jgi:CheY-like chemotaxis protein
VTIANNGHEAVDLVRRQPFDVVLMDIQMPGLDGVQATHQIRKLAPPESRTPIIAMTAHAMTEARYQYLAEGMDDYISKPVDPNLLLEMLDGIARQSPAGRAARPSPAVPGGARDLDALAGLNDIAEALSRAPVEEMIREFMAELPQQLAAIHAAIAAGNTTDATREAHTLTGTAGNLGVAAVSLAARRLVEALRGGDRDKAEEAAQDLAGKSRTALEDLRHWLEAGPAVPDAGTPANVAARKAG